MSALVIGVYSFAAHSGVLESPNPNPGDSYYNLLVQGFRAGQLSLKKEVPAGLAQIADPYDPAANAPYRSEPYRMLDMSYYKGRLFLYFGVTPALILFWPFVALTGHYLFHRQAVVVFCSLGFLANVGLLRALWRRYFAEVGVGVVAACVLALGLATGVPVLLSRSDVYQVPISCGYMLTMLALGAIWCALHEPEPRKFSGWLAAASVAYGLAVGARPNLLFGAVILLVPVIQARRERKSRKLSGLAAATVPILLIGTGLVIYNFLRFDDPFEFGMRYQLAPDRMDTEIASFSLRYFWFHFRVYFVEPARWSSRFPFVHEIAVPPSPISSHGHVPFNFLTSIPMDKPFGILTNVPLVWLALAVPLTWRARSSEACFTLRGFLAAVALFLGICAMTICLFRGGNLRYEVDFLPAMVLLAVVGIVGLECALAPTSESGLAARPVWRRAARGGWGLLLAFSVIFNLLAGIENYAEADNNQGVLLTNAGRFQEAIKECEWALWIKPDAPEPHYNLGNALEKMGKHQEAIGHYEQALRIKPDYAEAHNNLGNVLELVGRTQEAIGHYEQALRIDPDFAGVHNNLGLSLQHVGRLEEAIRHYEQALRIGPDSPEAHYNLGLALEQTGRTQEAIGHYQEALRIKPDLAEAQNGLARLRAVQ